jgi:hypothetical protein
MTSHSDRTDSRYNRLRVALLSAEEELRRAEGLAMSSSKRSADLSFEHWSLLELARIRHTEATAALSAYQEGT